MTGGLLVMGATGQIGQFLMCRAGARATLALARTPRDVRGAPAQAFEAKGSLPSFDGEWPDAAISTLPIWLLAGHLEELAARGTRRLVCFSTTSIFGKADTRNAHERAVVEKVTAAERHIGDICAANGVELTILRPTLIYGAGVDKTVTAAARFIPSTRPPARSSTRTSPAGSSISRPAGAPVTTNASASSPNARC